MKIKFLGLLGLLGLIATGCGAGSHNKSTQDEVKDFARYFVEKMNAGQIDSIKNAYPQIIEADSLISLTVDTIGVVESNPGEFIVTLSPEVTLTMKLNDDGHVTVMESKGLFAYSQDKMDMARQTGLWNEGLNDVELDTRMKDKGFEEYLKKLSAPAANASGKILSIGKLKNNGSDSYNMQSVINNSDMAVKGSDYTVTVKTNREGKKPTYSTKPGKDIPPHGSVQYQMVFGMEDNGDEVFETSQEISKINMKTSLEPSTPKMENFTGSEYQQYLESKK